MSHRVSEKSASPAVLPAHRVVQTAEAARVGQPHRHAPGSPTIELIRDGDLVKAIDVTCSCGEKLRIWCSYENP